MTTELRLSKVEQITPRHDMVFLQVEEGAEKQFGKVITPENVEGEDYYIAKVLAVGPEVGIESVMSCDLRPGDHVIINKRAGMFMTLFAVGKELKLRLLREDQILAKVDFRNGLENS